MKRLHSRVAAIVATLSCAGCANLTVTVDLYTGPRPVLTRDDATRFATDTLADPAFDPSERRKNEMEFRKALQQSVFGFTKDALVRNKAAPEAAADVATSAATAIDRGLDTLLRELDPQAMRVRQVAADTLISLSNKADGDMLDPVSKLLQAHLTYSNSSVSVKEKLDEAVCRVNSALCPHDSALKLEYEKLWAVFLKPRPDNIARDIAASERTTGRIAGYPMFDSEFARLPTGKSKYWKRFYTGEFSGYGGNARFVVVRQGLIVYDQKSLDFDPTPTIGAATALTKAGLKLAAAMALGKVTSTSVAAPGSTTPPEVKETEVINKVQMAAQQDAVTQRDAARAMTLEMLAKSLKRIESRKSLNATQIETTRKEVQSILKQYQGILSATEVAK